MISHGERREFCGMFGYNGIVFNHESTVREEISAMHKMTRALARIQVGLAINWSG